MRALYYRTEKVSSRSLVLLAVIAMLTLVVIEVFPQHRSGESQQWMRSAASRTDFAFELVRQRRVELGHRMLSEQDPSGSGLLGPSMSMVTTLPGHLDAKQTSANPNFAAVAVNYLVAAGAKPGDRVAIGCTGSFPALNIAVLSAAEAMGLEPTLISSAASSQFGANHPSFMWPEMQKYLVDRSALTSQSVAVSRGGFRDRAAGMTDDTRRLLDEAIERGGRPLLQSEGLADAIDRRMQLFAPSTGDVNRYVAYVNVGGGSASVGGTKGNDQLGHGVISPSQYRHTADPIDSVASRFLRRGVPVVNMINVVTMAREHGLPVASEVRPEVGQGEVFLAKKRRKPLATAGIVILSLMTMVVVRPPRRLTETLARFSGSGDPETEPRWMV